jgi:hypothetical protein
MALYFTVYISALEIIRERCNSNILECYSRATGLESRQDTGNTDFRFRNFHESLQAISRVAHRLDHNCFLPDPLRYIKNPIIRRYVVNMLITSYNKQSKYKLIEDANKREILLRKLVLCNTLQNCKERDA